MWGGEVNHIKPFMYVTPQVCNTKCFAEQALQIWISV